MDGLFAFILILLILALVLYPIWRRYYCCGSTPGFTGPTGNCFPSVNFPVKSGLIDLRNCTDDVYILGDRNKVHFISVNP